MSQEDGIVRDYLSGVDVDGLARTHHRGLRTIARILRAAGVDGTLRRRRDEARRGRPSPAHVLQTGIGGCPTGTQWAYIAGLFDGEGSIVARDAPASVGVPVSSPAVRGGHTRYRVSLVQKDPTPLTWIREVVGTGDIYFANGTHRYQLQGQRAVFEFLQGIERHLVVKHTKARAALSALSASYGWEWTPRAVAWKRAETDGEQHDDGNTASSRGGRGTGHGLREAAGVDEDEGEEAGEP